MHYTKRKMNNVFLLTATFVLFSPAVVLAYLAAPVAITREVTFVTEKSATLGGRVNANEMPDSKQWFEWGLSGQSGSAYETPHYSIGGGQLADTSVPIYGLAPNTQYFYRQIAENGRGRDVGTIVYFTTKPLPIQISPIVLVQTNDASTVTEGGAILKGYISPHQNTSTKWWFQWGETNKFENETSHYGFGQDSGPVTATLSSLTTGTVYYYRLVAQTEVGLIYGGTKVFVTPGVTPQKTEVARDQNIPTPQVSGDGVARTTTNSGAATPAAQSGGRLPGDIFGAFFGRKADPRGVGYGVVTESPKTSPVPTTTVAPVSQQTNSKTNEESQLASAAASSPLGGFWSALTGKKDVVLTIEKVGPKKIPIHTPVEYRIQYSYFLSESANNGKLKIILPVEVVYIGDSTNNELLLEDSAGPEHTYVLPLGRLEKGGTRTISILGMTTGDAKGFPDARARIEYSLAAPGVHVVSAQSGKVSTGSGEAEAKSASIIESEGGFLPNSLLGWLIYVGLVTGFIFAFRKAKSYYEKRKEEIALEEEASARHGDAPEGYPGQLTA